MYIVKVTESASEANFTISEATYQDYPPNVFVVFVEINSTSVPEAVIIIMKNQLRNLSAETIVTGFQPSCKHVIQHIII